MNEQKIVEIEVELEFGDFWRTIFWQTLNTHWLIYSIALFITTPLFFAALYGIATNFSKAKFSPLLIFPFLPLIVVVLSQWGIYSSAKRGFNAVKGTIRYLFSEDGYDVFSTVGQAELGWGSLEEIQEKSKEFLLFPQKSIFFIIPKRCFASETQIADFRELVYSQMGAKAKLKKIK